jgi:hypothetical protein
MTVTFLTRKDRARSPISSTTSTATRLLADKPWTDEFVATSFNGQVPIYSGVTFAPLTFNFPVAGITEFVAEIYEVGFVDGFPKIVHFKKVGPDWDMTELY